MIARTTLAIAAAVLLIPACERADDQQTDSITRDDVLGAQEALDPTVAAALDSGNIAYRDGDYDRALRQYQRAADGGDDVAAAWFGVYMAHLALGNMEEADQAMARAQALAPGASLIHPERGDRP